MYICIASKYTYIGYGTDYFYFMFDVDYMLQHDEFHVFKFLANTMYLLNITRRLISQWPSYKITSQKSKYTLKTWLLQKLVYLFMLFILKVTCIRHSAGQLKTKSQDEISEPL